MKYAIAFLIGTISFTVSSQTDIIEYRSHSGNMYAFTKFSTPTIDGIATNFGMAPIRRITTAALDTVKYLENGKSVMVTSEYCRNQNLVLFDVNGEPLGNGLQGDLWRAGADTMANHSLFSHQHSLDSIKSVLALQYNFQNSIDSVVFVGFDNLTQDAKEGKGVKEEIDEVDEQKKETDQFGLPILLGILLPILLIYISSPFIFGWMKRS